MSCRNKSDVGLLPLSKCCKKRFIMLAPDVVVVVVAAAVTQPTTNVCRKKVLQPLLENKFWLSRFSLSSFSDAPSVSKLFLLCDSVLFCSSTLWPYVFHVGKHFSLGFCVTLSSFVLAFLGICALSKLCFRRLSLSKLLLCLTFLIWTFSVHIFYLFYLLR